MTGEPIHLRAMGGYHLGGGRVTLSGLPLRSFPPVRGAPPVTVDPNGTYIAGQMYVQFAHLVAPRWRLPLSLWHGGGLTGAVWEGTPDGRPGWQTAFLAGGFDVLLCDAVERGRAGWARFPDIFPPEPVFLPQHAVWELYRIGDAEGFATEAAERRGFPGSRFPVDHFDAFTRQLVPRWPGNEPLIEAAYHRFVKPPRRVSRGLHAVSAGAAAP